MRKMLKPVQHDNYVRVAGSLIKSCVYPFDKRVNMKHTTINIALVSVILSLILLTAAPSKAFAWGAGVHSTLTAHAHERMSARFKDSLDRGLLIYGSWGPDVWYILSDSFMGLLCPIACGGDDGRISNECWGRYNDPDRYFAYTRHLLVNADSLEATSWAFGYGAHAVEDWRGHMEYIIPDWVNPSGSLYNRHTLIDSAGAALVFNVEGLYGYPTEYTMDKHIFGYVGGGFLSDANADSTEGTRIAGAGASVRIDSDDKRELRWYGILDEEYTGLKGESVSAMSDRASLGSASEGILAKLYGLDDYDSIGASFPIIVEEDSVALECGTDYAQRMECDEGYGYPIACQISYGSVSGLAQWDSYLKPADDSSDDIVVDREEVTKWMNKIAGEFQSGDNRLDDKAVFGINPETGLSEKHLYGVDERDFTYGRSMPEIINEVLDFSINDVVTRLFENPHMIGTVLQSRLSPVDKARFMQFGFNYRPRMSAWPDKLEYEGKQISLVPGAPGSFAKTELAFDIGPQEINSGNELVFPWYMASIKFDLAGFHGKARLRLTNAYRNREGETLGEEALCLLDPETMQFEGQCAFAETATEGEETILRVLLDNREGGWHYYLKDGPEAALVLTLDLEIPDDSQPPFDLIADLSAWGYCEKPDLQSPLDPPDDNTGCALAVPDFPEPETENESESDGDMEAEIEVDDDQAEAADSADGDLDEEAADKEAQAPVIKNADDSDEGCASSDKPAPAALLLVFAILFLLTRIRSRRS